MHKIVEKCRSGVGSGWVGISYNSTFRYTGPWHTRIAITFVRFNIFTCGFLQRFKHRLDLILSFVLSQGNFLVLSQDATFSFVTGVVGVGALARARIMAYQETEVENGKAKVAKCVSRKLLPKG